MWSVRRRALTAASRAVELGRRIPTALAILLVIAIALRLAMSLAYRPAVMNFSDSLSYVMMADGNMFGDAARPAGYSMFLKLAHAVSSDLDVTIALQHLLGIGAGVLMYAAVMRIGAPRWTALASGAAIWLSLDQVLAEHTPVSESTFTFGIIAVVYASVRALDDPRHLLGPLTSRHAWIVGAGAGLALTAWIRGVAAPILPFLALWIALAIPGRIRERVGRAVLAAAAGAAIVLLYFSLNASTTGHFALTRTSGWALYGRAALFADCEKFDPPAGTEQLCEDEPFAEGVGPDSYVYDERSPAQRLFGGPPNGDSQLRAFALEAIRHQPFPYLLDAFNDTVRYFAPGYHFRDGGVFVTASINLRDPAVEDDIYGALRNYYSVEPLTVDDTATRVLSDLQQILRVHAVLMLEALIVGVVGIGLATGRVRAGITLLLGISLLLLVIPSATVSWSPRYALPGSGPFVAAGAIGLWLIIQRVARREEGGAKPAEPSAPG